MSKSTIQPLTIRLSPGIGHVFTSDDPLLWEFFNCGPGQALVERTVLSPGEVAAFLGTEPLTLMSWDNRNTVVVALPAFS
jgi:hypothetical protein